MLTHRAASTLRQSLLVPLLLLTGIPVQGSSPEPALAPAHARDRVIVGFTPAAGPRQRRQALGSVRVASSRSVSPVAPGVSVVELRPGQAVGRVIRKLEAQAGVAYAEPDYRVWPAATPDDPRYLDGSLWGMYGGGTAPHANAWGSGAAAAWAHGTVGSAGVHVGILDEGIRIDHAELAGNVWRNPFETVDGTDEDGNGYVDDTTGWDFVHDDASVYDGTLDDHGTHVAGTIGARGGNGRGVAGVNWHVTMIPAKFIGAGGGYVSDAIRALDYITDLKTRHGLEIVATNNSWSGGGFSQALHDAIARGGDAGILFIAAAGNDGRDADTQPAYPGAYRCDIRADGTPRGWDCVVSVASLQPDGRLAADSNWGAATIDLGAPGRDILSTHPAGDDGYASLSGTSMAAAHVSGAVALCASTDRALPARRLRGLLLQTGAATNALAGRSSTGARLDIDALRTACEPSPDVTVTIDDLDAAFHRYGSGWRASDGGHAGYHYWAAARETTRTLYGAWKPVLAAAGWYDVLVHVPAEHASSRRASYRVRTSAGWVTRIRNQHKRSGTWVSLGIHHLSSTPIVQLSDKTGEAPSLARRLAFDAARFVPVAGPPATSLPVAPD